MSAYDFEALEEKRREFLNRIKELALYSDSMRSVGRG